MVLLFQKMDVRSDFLLLYFDLYEQQLLEQVPLFLDFSQSLFLFLLFPQLMTLMHFVGKIKWGKVVRRGYSFLSFHSLRESCSFLRLHSLRESCSFLRLHSLRESSAISITVNCEQSERVAGIGGSAFQKRYRYPSTTSVL